MKDITIKAEISTMIDGRPVYEVLRIAADLAHEVIEELSIYRQENNLDSDIFSCEASACAFLDLIDD